MAAFSRSGTLKQPSRWHLRKSADEETRMKRLLIAAAAFGLIGLAFPGTAMPIAPAPSPQTDRNIVDVKGGHGHGDHHGWGRGGRGHYYGWPRRRHHH
jgi:hypothetical protein